MKKSASFRFTDSAIRMLKAIAAAMGISQAAALEVAIRDLAKKRGVK
jgi:hypothetical protein